MIPDSYGRKKWRLVSFGENYMDINFNSLVKLKRKLYKKDLEIIYNEKSDEYIFMTSKPRRLECWRCKVPMAIFDVSTLKIILPESGIQLCFEEISEEEEDNDGSSMEILKSTILSARSNNS